MITLRNLGPASIAMFLGALALLACSGYFAFQLGCTADLKAGHFGDPKEALRLSETSFSYFALGLAAGAVGFALARGAELLSRIALAASFLVFGGIAFWAINFYLEGAGTTACYAA